MATDVAVVKAFQRPDFKRRIVFYVKIKGSKIVEFLVANLLVAIMLVCPLRPIRFRTSSVHLELQVLENLITVDIFNPLSFTLRIPTAFLAGIVLAMKAFKVLVRALGLGIIDLSDEGIAFALPFVGEYAQIQLHAFLLKHGRLQHGQKVGPLRVHEGVCDVLLEGESVEAGHVLDHVHD